MIKVGVEEPTRPKYILSANTKLQGALSFQGSGQFIPIDVNTRLVTNSSSSVNDLGRELLKSAAEGNVGEVKSLLTKGAPFLSDWLGTTPLHLAVQSNNVEVCEILLRAGISKDAKNKVDRSPLHLASYEGHVKVVETLIKHEAEIDCLDLLNMTPLHWAVQNGHAPVVECLLKNGAAIQVANKFNLTPAAIALQIGRQDIIDLLQEYSGPSISVNEDEVDVMEASEPVVEEDPDQHQVTFLRDEILSQIVEDMEAHSEDEVESPLSAVKSLQKQLIQSDKEESSILNKAMESGHSVVLTEAGKEILKSVKESEEEEALPKKAKNIITVTPEQFLAMMKAYSARNLGKVKVAPSKASVKRIVMRKNKLTPVGTAGKAVATDPNLKYTKQDMEVVTRQLVEAKKLIEEYKVKLHRKEQEAERYKNQLKVLMDFS
ncbi:GA-binding protein subunit beta-1 [Cylas formicarius]|uniref:GA-binding protein subunit beta-1 n=1 Tax=Cylas formicarius TaxID=197179 RepID=UPI002958ACEB|nr:GA-binding protein subunit beta-1 [Cylas formicarius]XP_060525064.1 GA-binding protein subunit beta-1 [Cylas formicarius]